ncbi:hypothetical protein P691DRAFT_798995 [Macrolepiota fuliginosa MF-IS2]|uniref:DUF1996 domain-containing protein n=1 Tax=Macrolepiota fuliginosa MF-IS2 TaxID=1400762 RepID=A0A9P5XEX3_9AGAR|nr:hypothetical protein P691DRAFT_798995 [Macrolepiota fuliginosa MF-IS2]
MNLPLSVILALAASAQAYWLMGIEDFITTERIDPIVNPGQVSGHVHSVLGGSNFRFNTNTQSLRESECTSIPIPEDKSSYWFPHLWSNGSFSSLNGGAVIYYLFNDKPGTTTAFPDDVGDPYLRTYDPNSFAQQAVTFLCLDFNGVTTRYNSLPAKSCPSGIRAQINFPSCWDGKNADSSDHKSHVAFLSGGADSGTCSDPKFPVTLPRIFIEVYWASNDFEQMRSQAKDSSQPFVFAHGDPTGYGYHADFINGWDKGVLQNAVDKCHCDIYGDPTCCVNQGIFHMNKGQTCRITKSINEATTGTLPKLPGNNPVQPEGQRATAYTDNNPPELISPVYAYTGDSPAQTGAVQGYAPTASTPATPVSSSVPAPSSTNAPASSPASSSVSQQSHPSSSSAPSNTVVAPTSQTSAVQSTSIPAPAPSESTTISPAPSTSTVVAPAPTTTSYAHTIPATTTRAFPTFSMPSISIPTFSMPSMTFGSPNTGMNGAPHYVGNNGVPNGHHVFQGKPTASSTNLAPASPAPTTAYSSSGQGRCSTKAKRSRRGMSAEEIDAIAARDVVNAPAPPAADVQDLDRARRSHRRRFTNHFTN